MKFNKIMLFFGLTLPVSIILRLLQINFTIETKTGFYFTELKAEGTILLGLILLFCFLMFIFARLTFRQPEAPPNSNIYLCVSALLLSISILYEVVFSVYSTPSIPWQALLLKLAGVATAIGFLLFAISPFINLKLPTGISALPTVYLIIRMICDFTSISKLALISDNIIIIAVYCFTLLFFLNFAKLYNGLDEEKNAKKLLSYGLPSVILCFTNSLPNIVTHLTTPSGYLHTPMATNVSVLFFGIFIFTFLILHFKKNT